MGQVNYLRYSTRQKYDEDSSNISSDSIIFIQDTGQIINDGINYSSGKGIDILTSWSQSSTDQQVYSAKLVTELYNQIPTLRGFVWAGRLLGNGTIQSQYSPEGVYYTARKISTGKYRLTHLLNTRDYYVMITSLTNGSITNAIIESFEPTYFDYSISFFNGNTWIIGDGDAHVIMFKKF